MHLFNTDGLKNTDVSPKDTVPIFLDDDFRAIEGPSYWAIALAQKSPEA